MDDKPGSTTARPAKSPRVQHREARLKAALKANMAKRKAQVRGRAADTDASYDTTEET